MNAVRGTILAVADTVTGVPTAPVVLSTQNAARPDVNPVKWMVLLESSTTNFEVAWPDITYVLLNVLSIVIRPGSRFVPVIDQTPAAVLMLSHDTNAVPPAAMAISRVPQVLRIPTGEPAAEFSR